MNLFSALRLLKVLLPLGFQLIFTTQGKAQLLIDSVDSAHANYVRACLWEDDNEEETFGAFKLDPPQLISGEKRDSEDVFNFRFSKTLNPISEPSRVSLGTPSMEAKILAVPLYSNVYFSNHRSRAFISAGGGALSIGVAGGGYEFNGRSGLLLRFSAHAGYSDRFYPIAGMRIGRSF